MLKIVSFAVLINSDKIKMFNIERIYPKDIIALVVLIFSLVLISKGINSTVSGIVIMIVTYYFVTRINYDGEPKRDLYERVKKLELVAMERMSLTAPPKIYRPGFEPPDVGKHTHTLKPIPTEDNPN